MSLDITPPPIPPETSTTVLQVREDVRTYARVLESILLKFKAAINEGLAAGESHIPLFCNESETGF